MSPALAFDLGFTIGFLDDKDPKKVMAGMPHDVLSELKDSSGSIDTAGLRRSRALKLKLERILAIKETNQGNYRPQDIAEAYYTGRLLGAQYALAKQQAATPGQGR